MEENVNDILGVTNATHSSPEVSKDNTFEGNDVMPSAKVNLNVAETTLCTIATISLIIGILALIVLMAIAAIEESWVFFLIGLGVFLLYFVQWAFLRVFVNISLKLDKLNILNKLVK